MIHPMKRIILCFDGTSQASNHGREEVPSNVTKLSLSLERWFENDDGGVSPQIVYYDAGVGTDEVGKVGKDITAGLGKTLDQKVCEAYHFIATNYCEGDELFFFGFSRGGFTARATAGLICRVGICAPEDLSQFWKMWAMYTKLPPSGEIRETAWYKAESPEKKGKPFNIKIHGEEKTLYYGEGEEWIDRTQRTVDGLKIQVVGVWDTVGSLGLPKNQFIDVSRWNEEHQFYNTEIHPSIKNAFHALALDEHRMTFSPVLWTLPPGDQKPNLVQCWFPGVHINIGGGSDNKNGDLEFLANTTFAWMIDRCSPLLDFNLEAIIGLLSSHSKTVDDILSQYSQASDSQILQAAKDTRSFWSGGPIVDSFEGPMYKTQGSLVRTPGIYYTDELTNECIHPIVHYMQTHSQDYSPKALKGFQRISYKRGCQDCGFYFNATRTKSTYEPMTTKLKSRVSKGWSWVTSWVTGNMVNNKIEKYEVRIPEFVIPESVNSRSGDVPGKRGYMCSVERLLMVVSSNSINQKAEKERGWTRQMSDESNERLGAYLDDLLKANNLLLGPPLYEELPEDYRTSKDWNEVAKLFPQPPLLRIEESE